VTPFEEMLEKYRTKCEDWGNMGRDAVLDQLTELEDALLAHVAQLEADRDRLEWLEFHTKTSDVTGATRWTLFMRARGASTLREAIDQAIKGGQG
jgi:hypothetical protein